MGEVISSGANVDDIAEDVGDAYQNGMARGGEIAEACKDRLAPSVQAIENAKTLYEATRKAASAAWVIVLAMDNDADNAIGSVRDEMWNALGRPRQSPHMDEVYPGGTKTYTAGDPQGQPLRMAILRARILSASAPQWPEQKRAAWADTIEAARVPYASAVDAYRPTEAAETVAEAGYRSAVRAAHARLVSFKRDLKSLGLTEAQIHEIIPDASAKRRKKAGGE
ncbi:MAG: hypothetical protein IPM54_12055 [Polyangiaceae bacterium]|nr:hypothetical protein [Polyangiaceae bacterium]